MFPTESLQPELSIKPHLLLLCLVPPSTLLQCISWASSTKPSPLMLHTLHCPKRMTSFTLQSDLTQGWISLLNFSLTFLVVFFLSLLHLLMLSHISGSKACRLNVLSYHGPPTFGCFFFCARFERNLHLSLHSAHCGAPRPSNFHNAVGVREGEGGRVNTTASRSH